MLVHGLAGAAYNFTELAPLLARRRRVLIPDLPGHGGTARPFRPWRAWVTWPGTSPGSPSTKGWRPAAVLGYSMGGVLALRLAAEQPEAVSAVAASPRPGSSRRPAAPRLWLAATTALRPARLVAHARGRSRAAQSFARRSSATGAPRSRATSLRRRCSASSRRSRSTPTSSGPRGRLRATIRAPISTACAARRSSSGGRATGSRRSRTASSSPQAPRAAPRPPGRGHLVVGECPQACAEPRAGLARRGSVGRRSPRRRRSARRCERRARARPASPSHSGRRR